MRLPGFQLQPSRAGPVESPVLSEAFLLRAARVARPQRAPAGNGVARTAIVGGGLAVACGLVTAQSPFVARPAVSGLCTAALIVATTAVGCIALHRGLEQRLWLVLTTLAVYAATTLDSLSAPALDLLGQIACASVVVVAVYLLLSFPHGRLPDAGSRVVFALTAVSSAVVWGALLATAGRLPEFMPTVQCYDACPRNPFRILHGGPALTEALAIASWWLTAAAFVGVAFVLTRRVLQASSIGRRTTLPIVAAVLAVAGTMTAGAASRATGADPATLERIGAIWAVVGLAVPLAFLLGMLAARIFAGEALERVVVRLNGAAGDVSVRRILADALGDPSLTVAFWRPGTEEYVNARGRPVQQPAAGATRSSTVVRRDGRPLAMIVHDGALAAEPDLVASAGGAALMMLETARLEADLRASVAELSEARARLAGAGDAGRREIERTLHDGPQRQLLALWAKLAYAEANAAPDWELERTLGELGADAQATLDELRSLARGVYPALLADHGLASALASVAARSVLPLSVVAEGIGRLGPEIEATLYFCSLEALQNCVKHAGPDATAKVSVHTHDGRVFFEVSDDGVGFDVDAVPRGRGLTNLRDRVAAVGGQLDVVSHRGRGTVVSASMPAAT